MEVNQITEAVIGAAIEVHRTLGPGLLESVYEECLCRELSLRNIPFKRQVSLPISYKGIYLDSGYRLDLLVDGMVVVEIKAVEQVLPVHEVQLVTYLKLGSWPVGLLLNFNVPILKKGIIRRVWKLEEKNVASNPNN
jgi:GxxExxY protein